MKMYAPEMTIKREQALDLYPEQFEEAAAELYAHNDLDGFMADDICQEVIEQVTDTNEAREWVESLTDENRRAIVTAMREYFEEYILNVVHNNFDYIMSQNHWEKERE